MSFHVDVDLIHFGSFAEKKSGFLPGFSSD